MKFTTSTPSTAIKIQNRIFNVPQPFDTGHALTAGEAAALNGLLGENLRNNFAATVRTARLTAYAAMSGQSEVTEIPVDAIEAVDAAVDWDALQKELLGYAAEYEFGSGRRPAMSELERETLVIARAAVTATLKGKGIRQADLPEGKFASLVADAIANYPAITEQAKKVIASRAKVGEIALTL